MTDDFARFSTAFRYDSETGKLYWRQAYRSDLIGKEAGCPHNGGRYWAVFLDNERHLAHRVAWLLVHGDWPNGPLDHINRNGCDNRISNLRQATPSQNSTNRLYKNKKDGMPKGISKRYDKYYVSIVKNGKRRYLGCFENLETAVSIYRDAAIALHGDFACVA